MPQIVSYVKQSQTVLKTLLETLLETLSKVEGSKVERNHVEGFYYLPKGGVGHCDLLRSIEIEEQKSNQTAS
jgi:hypothetical protein